MERCVRNAGVVLGSWGRVVNGWQRKGIRSGDVRLNFDVIAEGCLVLPDPGFVSDVEVVVVVVDGVQGISGTGCAVMAWRYELRGNSKEGGKQRQKQLQMKPRGLRALGMFRQLEFSFTSEVWQAAGDTGIDKCLFYVHFLHCSLSNIPVVKFRRLLLAIHVARMSY